MRIHIIACQVFYREISFLAAQSTNATTVTWMPQGLHDSPDKLRKSVAAEIERLETAIREGSLKHNPEQIVLGYGLCSNGVVGLESGELPIIVPRTDDCIGVFVGSQKRYLQLFKDYPGTYWLNNGWLESAFIPIRSNYESMRALYVELYGEDNADYLMESETSWIANYHYCGYIRSPIFRSVENEEKIRRINEECGWDLVEEEGSNRMLDMMLSGEYPEDEFLYCPPHHRIVASYDDKKLAAVPIE